MSKKYIIIIISAVLIIAITVVSIIWFLSKKPAEVPTEPETPGEQAQVPLIEQKIFTLSTEPALAPSLSQDGSKIRYFVQSNGNIFETSFDGKDVLKFSSIPVSDIIKAKWSPSKEQAIVESLDLLGTKKTFFDYKNKKTQVYNKNIKDIAFSPSEDKIAYQYIDDSQAINNISVANPDSSDWKTVFNTRFRDLNISWVTGSKIILSSPSSGLVEKSVYSLNPLNGNFEKVFGSLNGLSVLWSPSGNSFLFSKTDARGKNLSLGFLGSSGEPKDLNIKTFSEKCVFSKTGQYVFCAVPSFLPADAVFPDDYYKNKITTTDEILKIAVDGSFQSTAFTADDFGGNLFDIINPILSPNEDYLIFINKNNGLLYSIKLY